MVSKRRKKKQWNKSNKNVWDRSKYPTNTSNNKSMPNAVSKTGTPYKSSLPNVKNHIAANAKEVFTAMKNYYGIDFSLFDKCLSGDHDSITKVADFNKEITKVRLIMPDIVNAYRNIIQGTTEYNQNMADLAVEAANSQTAINRAVQKVESSYQQYLSKKVEDKQEHYNALELEKSRHDLAMSVIELKNSIDSNFANQNYIQNYYGLMQRPVVAQLQADEKYDTDTMKMLAKFGSPAPLNTVYKKSFHTIDPPSIEDNVSTTGKGFTIPQKISNAARNMLSKI